MNPELALIVLTLVSVLLIVTTALASRKRPTSTAARPADTRRRNSRSRNRRNNPVKLTPGMFAGTVQPDRNTTCSRCRGAILRGESCARARNGRGLICPGCRLS
jgi:hypothetical protein